MSLVTNSARVERPLAILGFAGLQLIPCCAREQDQGSERGRSLIGRTPLRAGSSNGRCQAPHHRPNEALLATSRRPTPFVIN